MTLEEVKCKVKIQTNLSNEFECNTGLRQGDALSCLLFNIAMEKVVRDSGLQRERTIFTKSIQSLGYADDVDIIGRSFRALTDAFLVLESNAKNMGHVINERKKKYLTSGRNYAIKTEVQIEGYTFETVDRFTYLGAIIQMDSDTTHEIKRRINMGNKCYYWLLSMKSRVCICM